MKIATIGLWHLGTIYSVCLAELGNRVTSFTKDLEFADKLEKGETDLYEPKLIDLLIKNRKAGLLTFLNDLNIVKNSDVVWVTIDTPTDSKDLPDVSGILDTIKAITPKLKKDAVLIVSSQLPVGTCIKIEGILNKNRKKKIGFAYVPENLRLGQSVDNFFHQDRVVIGTNDDRVFKKIKTVLGDTTKSFIMVNPQTAEMIKHATNSFLATSLSFINDISDLCEKVGADVFEVASALRADGRIGPKAYLGAGLGFSGVTLGRDLAALIAEAKHQKIELSVIPSVKKKNELRETFFSKRLHSYIKRLKGKDIGVWGVSYKEGVSTLRGSLPIKLIKKIVKLGANIKIYGNKTSRDKIFSELPGKKVQILDDPYQVLEKTNVLLLLSPVTDKEIDFSKVKRLMKPPYLVFDCYNSFYGYEEKFGKNGILYAGVGRYVK